MDYKYRIGELVYVKKKYRDCSEREHTLWYEGVINGLRKRKEKNQWEIEYTDIDKLCNDWIDEQNIITNKAHCIQSIKMSIVYFKNALKQLEG